MNRPFEVLGYTPAELSAIIKLMSFGSLQCENTGAKTPPPPLKTAQHGRVEVVYIGGCYNEAQNVKRWLAVSTGTLYDSCNGTSIVNGGFVAAGAHNARPIYVNRSGDAVRFMQQTTLGGTPVNTRIPVVYKCGKWLGTFLLDVDTGILYSGDGVTIQGHGYKRNMGGTYVGEYNKYTVVPVQLPAQETKVAVTYLVGTTAFNIEYEAIHHAKHMAMDHPGKEFTVDKVTTTKVVTKSKPYKVTETAQVKTVKTKSWE